MMNSPRLFAPRRLVLWRAAFQPPQIRQSCTTNTTSTPPSPKSARRWIAPCSIFALSAGVSYYYYLPTRPVSSSPASDPSVEEARLRPRKAPRAKTPATEVTENGQGVPVGGGGGDGTSPGVWAWGSNAGRVVEPEDGAGAVARTPRKIRFFDGAVLRDLKLARDFGAAVTEAGDVVQWGVAYSQIDPRPTQTLTGRGIIKVELSADRVIALSSDGHVYSIPVSRDDQVRARRKQQQQGQQGQQGQQDVEEQSPPRLWPSLWPGLWSSPSASSDPAAIGCRILTPPGLAMREHVVDISSGREHCLLLTSRGRVFCAAASTTAFPTRGQLGIPGLTWDSRPAGVPYDTPHEIAALRDARIVKVAAGEFHSAALDFSGQIWTWGDNTFGQLGIGLFNANRVADAPRRLPVKKLYAGTGLEPKVTALVAGGTNTYFAVDAAPPPPPPGITAVWSLSPRPAAAVPAVADLWACGTGLGGQLGDGRWAHIGDTPTKITTLSSLVEYDERARRTVPVRLTALSAGATHACAVLGGGGGSGSGSSSADVMVWGGNEHFQLGTGRRSNASRPVSIAPLEGAGERMQLSARSVVQLAGGRKVSVEQRVVCGQYVTAVYSAVAAT